MTAESVNDKIHFQLYIKASVIDKETKGSCPMCQHWFMIACLLGERQDDLEFKVFTVQADCPPPNFVDRGWSKKFPVVEVTSGRSKTGKDIGGMYYDTSEELGVFFESINTICPFLKEKNAPNVSAMKACESIYTYFNHFLSGKGSKNLDSELRKINDFICSEGTTFLVDDILTFADCFLLPRLQHIRVAGKFYQDWDIPMDCTHLWKYLHEAYKVDAFRSTMPSDQDIIMHYENKVTMPKNKRMTRPTLENFTHVLEIPQDVMTTIYGTNHQ